MVYQDVTCVCIDMDIKNTHTYLQFYRSTLETTASRKLIRYNRDIVRVGHNKIINKYNSCPVSRIGGIGAGNLRPSIK